MLLPVVGVRDNIHTLREALLGIHDINCGFASGGRGTGQLGERIEKGTFHSIPLYSRYYLIRKLWLTIEQCRV